MSKPCTAHMRVRTMFLPNVVRCGGSGSATPVDELRSSIGLFRIWPGGVKAPNFDPRAMPLWEDLDSSDDETQPTQPQDLTLRIDSKEVLSHVGASSCAASNPTQRDFWQIDPNDTQTCAWWSKPMLAALHQERAVLGSQMRPLRLGTGCSGTEAPAFGLKAIQCRATCTHHECFLCRQCSIRSRLDLLSTLSTLRCAWRSSDRQA